jgi:hypothetical protein
VQTTNDVGVSVAYNTLYPIMQGSVHGDGSRDLGVAEFFSHAEILSGQDVGTVKGYAARDHPEALALQDGGWIERAGNALESTRKRGVRRSTSGTRTSARRDSRCWRSRSPGSARSSTAPGST